MNDLAHTINRRKQAAARTRAKAVLLLCLGTIMLGGGCAVISGVIGSVKNIPSVQAIGLLLSSLLALLALVAAYIGLKIGDGRRRSTPRTLRLAAMLLPEAVRARYLEEWRGWIADARDEGAASGRCITEIAAIWWSLPKLMHASRARRRV